MNDVFRVPDMRVGYKMIVATVREFGDQVRPRGMNTREILNASIILDDPTDALPVGVGRKLNPAIAAAEALQLVAGVSDPALMSRITRNFDRFTNGGSFDGAYGPRIRHQVRPVVERLQNDSDTRQAIISIWDHAYDLFRDDSNDYPCTLIFQFFVRKGKLIMRTDMRSQDCWWGLAYDLFMFSMLQRAIAAELQLPVGSLMHNVGSLHVYERDFEAVDQLHEPPTSDAPDTALGRVDQPLAETQDAARQLLVGRQVESASPWWFETLAPYVA